MSTLIDELARSLARKTRVAPGLLAGAAALVALFATGAVAAPKPGWQTIPVGADDRGIVSAAGRSWFMNNGTAGGNFRTKTARVTGGRLTGWVTTTLPGSATWGVPELHGQELVFSTPGGLQAVKLLPNGRFGARRAFDTGAPPPAYSGGSSVVQLRDRVVQLVNACDFREPPAKPCSRDFEVRIGVCCDENGEAADYSSFVKRGLRPPLLGLDRRSRLWLAWTEARQERPAQIVQLDPKTLEPRGTPAVVPGSLFATRIVDFACSDVCRLVMEGFKRMKGRVPPDKLVRNFAWAPGEPSLTPMVLPGSNEIAFGVRLGPRGLEIAFNRSVGPNGETREVAVGRGDTRGRGVRVTSSIEVPSSLGSFERGLLLTIEPRVGAFGPGGFVTTALYEGRGKQVVRATILR